jgi:hypothetical protein
MGPGTSFPDRSLTKEGAMAPYFRLQLWLAPVRNAAWVSAQCGYR